MTDPILVGLVDEYLLEARERLDRVERMLVGLDVQSPDERGSAIIAARRELHTLKGNSSMMGFEDIRALAHRIEDLVARIDPAAPGIDEVLAGLDHVRDALAHVAPVGEIAKAAATADPDHEADSRLGSVRVSFAALDLLVEQLAEMVIFRNRLADSIERASGEGQTDLERVREAQQALGKNLSLLQDRIMLLRMVPLEVLFGRLERTVHDECSVSGKRARLETAGGETAMDKALIEVAHDALGHLVRNAVVHGIESPDARAAAGKPAVGSIRLTAGAEAGEVWMEVSDDGRGVDHAAVRAAAARAGIHVPSGEDASSLLFEPGVTTAPETSLSAGRGMGLSAVVEAVERVGGRVEVASGSAGSTFRLRLPLTVSIARALLLHVDGELYALPLAAVVETVKLGEREGRAINRAEVMTWRRRVLPLLDLGHCFQTDERSRARKYVVVIEADGRQRGLVVDDLLGMREIVIKALDPLLGEPAGVSGATILGDGRVVLILHPKELVRLPPFVVAAPDRVVG